MIRENIVTDLISIMRDQNYTVSEFSTDKNYINEYGPILDILVSNYTDHGVLVVESGESYYLMYTVSKRINDRYITMITDNSFENTVVESVEDLADVIIHQQNIFDNYINFIKE